jgi:hypothetical protein
MKISEIVEKNSFILTIIIGVALSFLIFFFANQNMWKETNTDSFERGLFLKDYLLKEKALKDFELSGSGTGIECFGGYKLYKNYNGDKLIICDN